MIGRGDVGHLTRNTVVVDWGTSSFRLWVLNRDGGVAAKIAKDCGMSALRPEQFQTTLETALSDVDAPETAPVIICGMAGAAQGWLEAPYVQLPISAENLAARAIRVPDIARPIFIVPGLAQYNDAAPDVMRGEETLLLGLILEHEVEGTVCLPGTHSKWVQIVDGRITQFQTAMTGEIFALLSKHSTLSHFLPQNDQSTCTSQAFRTAVREALRKPQRTLQSLFSIRAMPLLMGAEAATDMSARLSGLLIGLEIAGQDFAGIEPVSLVSHGDLGAAYETALGIAGLAVRRYDSEDMVRAGLFRIAHDLQLSMAI